MFSLLGTTNRRAVEICASDGIECNAANLIINHGWQALLVDGDADLVARGNSFYAANRNTWVSPPQMATAWVTTDNVCDLVTKHGFGGAIDLLSLDLDGNDYWIWKSLGTILPRVVVLEFNPHCGPEASVTRSVRGELPPGSLVRPYRCGASLPAFVGLGRALGYRLIGVQSLGFNAFFVRKGIGEDLLPEQSATDCFQRNERLRRWHPSWLDEIVSGPDPWETV